MITDDDLLLYYYRDGLDPAERARIGMALSERPELAQRLQTLVARLDAAAASMPEVPVPADVMQRWQVALESAAQADEVRAVTPAPRARRFYTDMRWQAAAAAAVVVALTLIIRSALQTSPDLTVEVAPPEVAPAAAEDASAYERGLKWHLASTERRLVGLESAKPEDRAQLVEVIIAQNRMYALAAEKAGEPQLARVLRAFAPVLENVAQDGGDPSASIARLNFELRIMQGRLNAGADTSSSTPSTSL